MNQATGHACQHYPVPVPSQDKLGGCGRKGILHKIGWMKDVGAPTVRMGWHPDGASATVLSLHHKIQKMVKSNGRSL